MKWRSTAVVTTVLLALSLTFGLVMAANAVTPAEKKAADEYRAKAAEKVARLSNSRITQEQREAAAAQIKLMKALSAVGSSGAPKASASTAGKSVVVADVAAPGPGGVPDYFGSTANWAYSPLLRKFVDKLPGLGVSGANNLGQFIGVGKPDTTPIPARTTTRSNCVSTPSRCTRICPRRRCAATCRSTRGPTADGANTLDPDPISYLGPFIVANKNRPCVSSSPTSCRSARRATCSSPSTKASWAPVEGPIPGKKYTQNRGTLHLHGGITPWISDGTPHQWITPASEVTSYPVGVSVKNVPDMPDPGPGSMTFFYSNQQSARLMFYHDHSFGITRLNVYAGEAAGYMITDATEKKLIDDGTVPPDQIPLIIQDKTFVDASTIATTDPTWNWGTTAPIPHTGDLWLPHVYVPAQNPALEDGVNPTGRWHYGPWFWPPVPLIRSLTARSPTPTTIP